MKYENETCSSSQETIVGVCDDTISKEDLEKVVSIDVEKLGRQRPEVFSSTLIEIAFVTSMIGSLAMADFLIGGFQVVLPEIREPLNIPVAAQTWPSSVLTLVAGAFLFPLGRLSDICGGYIVFNGGLIWFTLWTVGTGFSKNFMTLVVCRAMEGLGVAAFLPAGISLLGRIYRPGPRKNLVFSLYGAVAPVGFFMGLIMGGVAQEFLTWSWYFWIGSMITGAFVAGSLLTSPFDYAETRKMGVKMDWWGFVTTVPGLLFLVYAITDSAHAPQGWASPRILVTFVLGILFLLAAVYVEGWVAAAPLIPADIFKVPYMKRMLVCLFFTWGAFALYLFYSAFYIQLVIGMSPLLTGLWFAPWAAGGIFFATTSGLILHVLPGRGLLIISLMCKVVALLLFALMPEDPLYWAWVFPSMLCEAACVDIIWTVSNVYLTTSLPRHRQGLAGAVISVTLFLGSAFFLGVGDVALAHFKNDEGMDLGEQYRCIFWYGTGVAGAALLASAFIRLGKAGCALTVDEKMEKQVDDQMHLDAAVAAAVADKKSLSDDERTTLSGDDTATETGSVNEEYRKEEHSVLSRRESVTLQRR